MNDQLVLYKIPYFAPISRDYYVEVNGQPVDVHPVTVSSKPTNELYRGTQRGEEETEQASFINFDFSGTVHLRVICAWEIFCARVLPLSRDIQPVRGSRNKGDEVSFTITKPGQYILEINGMHRPLHIFANPMITDRPDPAAANVDYRHAEEKQDFPGNYWGKRTEIAPGKDTLYFGPGIHHVDLLELKSGQSVYIDGGAIVHGAIVAHEQENIRVYGRGILTGERFSRDHIHSGLTSMVIFSNCHNVRVEGVILKDSVTYHLSTVAGSHISVENVKVVSWRRNADGIDMHNTSYVTVKNCFVRTFDDAIVIKGQHRYMGYATNHQETAHILVEGCTIWGDWGRGLEFGAETSADAMRDITLRDCDIVHFAFVACDIQACGDAPISDVLFEDIRVHDPIDPLIGPRLMEIFIRNMLWMAGESLGSVRGITYRNISYNGLVICPIRFIGQSDEHNIRDISLENITLNGQRLSDEQHLLAPVILNDFADDISIDGKKIDRNRCRIETEEDTCNSYLVGNGAFIVI